MIRRLKLLFVKVFVIFHVGTMLLYAAQLERTLPSHKLTNPLRHLIIIYSKLTLGNHRFAFFAPEIPPYYSYKIFCSTKQGEKFQYDFSIPNREVQVRFNRMLRTISLKELRDPLFKSLANYIMKRNPDVVLVNIQVFRTDTPIMSDYRKGKRKITKPVYNVNYSS